jgi:hypothetical protein
MATNYNPTIVTSGMMLCLDVGNAKSYPGSGSVWTDLSGNGNTATLISSPTYSSTEGGYLTFNGTTQYATFVNSQTLANAATTIEMWIRTTSVALGYQFMYGKNDYPKFYLNGGDIAYYNGTMSGGGTITANVWKQVVVASDSTFTNFYIDGAASGTALGVAWSTTPNTTHIGRDTASATQYFSGRISVARVYNRVLTPQEVSQNFNALRGRYGL